MSKFSHNFKSAGSNLNFLTWFGKSVFVSLEKKEEEERESEENATAIARASAKGKGRRASKSASVKRDYLLRRSKMLPLSLLKAAQGHPMVSIQKSFLSFERNLFY